MIENPTEKCGKVVIITGSSDSIGISITMEFAKSDYCVMLNETDSKKLKQITEDIIDIIEKDDESISNKIAYYTGDLCRVNFKITHRRNNE